MNYPSSYRLYWGELHNHNELGYAQGTLERSYDIARSHLDFYAFTPHGMFADRPDTMLAGGPVHAYPVVEKNWDRIQQVAARNNAPGEFTCFLGYEWHSSAWGHVHVVYFDDHQSLHYAPTLAELQQHFRGADALLVPHHIAYTNGVDWDLFDEQLSPVIEIYSEHGCSERDIGLHPMLGHSGGPGDARFTAQRGLALGKRFGFVAGTDNHDGHPGGYGLGLTGVLAAENTRSALFDALRARRTLAVTGDRISVDFRAGDAPMGSTLSDADEISFQVEAWDFVRQVELVRDSVPVLTRATDYRAKPQSGEDRYRIRLEWGWGPMKGYQVFDWTGTVEIDGGRLEQVVPCFASDPFDERRRKRVTFQDAQRCAWQSHTSRGSIFTSRNSAASCRANDALCLEIRGTPQTRIGLEMTCETHTSLLATAPDWNLSTRLGRLRRSFTLAELFAGRQGFRVDDQATSVAVHRAVPRDQFTITGNYAEKLEKPACYYLRVTQENGQMAWASPIWIEA